MTPSILRRAARATELAGQRADLRLLAELEEAVAENRALNAGLAKQLDELEQLLVPLLD